MLVSKFLKIVGGWYRRCSSHLAHEIFAKNTKTEIERYSVALNEQASLIKISIKGEDMFVFSVRDWAQTIWLDFNYINVTSVKSWWLKWYTFVKVAIQRSITLPISNSIEICNLERKIKAQSLGKGVIFVLIYTPSVHDDKKQAVGFSNA